MAACPGLTELSVISPYTRATIEETDMEARVDPDGRAHPAMLKLTVACKALQDFNTLQIVRLPMELPRPRCDCDWDCETLHLSSTTRERWEELLERHVKDLGEWTIECLEKARPECLEGEERRRITLRTVEFSNHYPVKVKEYEL